MSRDNSEQKDGSQRWPWVKRDKKANVRLRRKGGLESPILGEAPSPVTNARNEEGNPKGGGQFSFDERSYEYGSPQISRSPVHSITTAPLPPNSGATRAQRSPYHPPPPPPPPRPPPRPRPPPSERPPPSPPERSPPERRLSSSTISSSTLAPLSQKLGATESRESPSRQPSLPRLRPERPTSLSPPGLSSFEYTMDPLVTESDSDEDDLARATALSLMTPTSSMLSKEMEGLGLTEEEQFELARQQSIEEYTSSLAFQGSDAHERTHSTTSSSLAPTSTLVPSLPGAWPPYMYSKYPEFTEMARNTPVTPRPADSFDNASQSPRDSGTSYTRKNPADKDIREDPSGGAQFPGSSGNIATHHESPPSSHISPPSQSSDDPMSPVYLNFPRRDTLGDTKAPFVPPADYKPYRKPRDSETTNPRPLESTPSSQQALSAPIKELSQSWIPPVRKTLKHPPNNFEKADPSIDSRVSGVAAPVVFHPPNRKNSSLSSTSHRTSPSKQSNQFDASLASKPVPRTQPEITRTGSSAQFQSFRPQSAKPPLGTQISSQVSNSPIAVQSSGFIPPSSSRRPSKSPDLNAHRPPVQFIPPSSSSRGRSTKGLHTFERS